MLYGLVTQEMGGGGVSLEVLSVLTPAPSPPAPSRSRRWTLCCHRRAGAAEGTNHRSPRYPASPRRGGEPVRPCHRPPATDGRVIPKMLSSLRLEGFYTRKEGVASSNWKTLGTVWAS